MMVTEKGKLNFFLGLEMKFLKLGLFLSFLGFSGSLFAFVGGASLHRAVLLSDDMQSTAQGAGSIDDLLCTNAAYTSGDGSMGQLWQVGTGARSTTHLRQVHGAILQQREFSRGCSNMFIKPNGDLGRGGKAVLDAVRAHGGRCFYDGGIDVSSLCPRFGTFTREEKEVFWVFVFASIAHHESSCIETRQARGVNGLADGLFQMEYGRTHRANAGRNPNLCKTRTGVNTQDLTFQAECSVSILKDTNCKYGKSLDWNQGYWHLLRRKTSFGIGKKILKFKGCHQDI